MSSATAAAELIRVKNVRKTYPDGNVVAVDGVDLTIEPGEYVAIMGPSGSGKSSLLNLLGTLDRPDSGEIYFNGENVTAMPDTDALRAHKIGFVFQSFLLLPTLTSLQNVQIPMFEGRLSAGQRERKAEELLHAVGIQHRAHHRPAQLSVGERQRVAIARALANDPVVLLADEPTGNLDSRSGAAVLDLFDHLHRDRGLTLIIVTHSDEVGQRAERLIRITDGRIVDDHRVQENEK